MSSVRHTAEEEDESASSGPPSSLPLCLHLSLYRCCLFSELNGYFPIMLKSLFVYGVLGVLLIPAQCNDKITVCIEDDKDLRVDCLIEPKPNKINSFEFSWSSGTKESLINTNVSGSSAESQFKDKSTVEELESGGYRMTLSGFTDKLPHNTTYMCTITGEVARINMEADQLEPCSAVSLFLKSSCSWIVCLLLTLYQTHS
ncbi:hypothetical protein INR49_027816 [Caranx melampygus]|nr:hypothetical protein INR49_027816 [Caranx melampygus]